VEDPIEGVFHASISEGRKSVHVFKFVTDDYMVVESFLQEAFKRKRSLSASDIADALEMDYEDVREALARMIKEGKLGVK
jgi:predicted ArsR family transcriptional regulator